MQGELELMEWLERQIAELDEQLRDATEPFAPQLDFLQSMPGVQAIAARDIMAEMGSDMSRFGSAKRWSSWAGVSPGHHESAGKGNRYLRRVLVQCAWTTRQMLTF